MDLSREYLRRAASRPLPCALALAVVYLALTWLSLDYVCTATGVALLGPASGVALAAFALAHRQWWPVLSGAVFVAAFAAEMGARDDVALAAALAAVDTLEAVLAAWVLVRIAGDRRRDITSLRTVCAIAAAAFGANAVTALIGTGVLQLATDGPFAETWTSWWLADGVGMLVVAPLILALVRPIHGRAGRLEATALMALTAGLTLAIVGHRVADGPVLLSYVFPIMPMLVWCALRLGTRGVTVAIVAVALIAAVATAQDRGPFALERLSQVERAQTLQAFIAVAVLSTLIVGAVVASQRRAKRLAFDEAERLASVLRSSEAAIIALDPQGRVTHWNPAAERMLGYSAQEMLGRGDPGIFDPDEVRARAAEVGVSPDFQLFVRAALHAEQRDWTWIAADGRRLTVSLAMTVQRDQAGRLTGFLAMATDVTAIREATRRLAASEARHRLVLNSLPDTQVYLYDRDLVCVLGEGQIPPKLREYGYVGRHISELAPDAAVEQLRPHFKGALAGRTSDATYMSKVTGRHHEIHFVPHRPTPDSAPDGVLTVMRDVTEDREREAAVRRAQADLRTIFDEAPVGNGVFDASLQLVEVNAALVALTGYDADQLRAAPIEALAHPEDKDRLIDLLRSVSRGRQRHAEAELALRRADGRTVDVALHVVGLGMEGDDRRRTLVQVVDISERKRFEEQLRHLADHDPLTGLLNRRRFEADLAAHMDRARRYGPQGAVMLVDVDGFKQVNDTLGHAAGDEWILAVAGILSARLRSSDAIGRLGGDEFAILLPGGDAEGFEAAARDLVEAVRANTDVTISVGVAALADATALTADQLLRDADSAMYEAKAAGRDGYAVFTRDRAGSARPPSSPTS